MTWEPKEQGDLPDDFWLVAFDSHMGHGQCYVSAETARSIQATLDLAEPPEWLTFRGLSGATMRIRTRLVSVVWEGTAEHRAFDRALERALDAETKAEKDWSTG